MLLSAVSIKIRIEAAMLRKGVEKPSGKPPIYPPLIPSPLTVGSFGCLRTLPAETLTERVSERRLWNKESGGFYLFYGQSY